MRCSLKLLFIRLDQASAMVVDASGDRQGVSLERIFGSFCQELQVWGVCTDNEVQSVGGEGGDSSYTGRHGFGETG